MAPLQSATDPDPSLPIDATFDQYYVLLEPVVSSALLIPSLHDTAVIEHVHTLAAYRRRGYGRWLLRALHAEAVRMGLHQVVLGSNDAGRALYSALGYESLCYQDVSIVGR